MVQHQYFDLCWLLVKLLLFDVWKWDQAPARSTTVAFKFASVTSLSPTYALPMSKAVPKRNFASVISKRS